MQLSTSNSVLQKKVRVAEHLKVTKTKNTAKASAERNWVLWRGWHRGFAQLGFESIQPETNVFRAERRHFVASRLANILGSQSMVRRFSGLDVDLERLG